MYDFDSVAKSYKLQYTYSESIQQSYKIFKECPRKLDGYKKRYGIVQKEAWWKKTGRISLGKILNVPPCLLMHICPRLKEFSAEDFEKLTPHLEKYAKILDTATRSWSTVMKVYEHSPNGVMQVLLDESIQSYTTLTKKLAELKIEFPALMRHLGAWKDGKDVAYHIKYIAKDNRKKAHLVEDYIISHRNSKKSHIGSQLRKKKKNDFNVLKYLRGSFNRFLKKCKNQRLCPVEEIELIMQSLDTKQNNKKLEVEAPVQKPASKSSSISSSNENESFDESANKESNNEELASNEDSIKSSNTRGHLLNAEEFAECKAYQNAKKDFVKFKKIYDDEATWDFFETYLSIREDESKWNAFLTFNNSYLQTAASVNSETPSSYQSETPLAVHPETVQAVDPETPSSDHSETPLPVQSEIPPPRQSETPIAVHPETTPAVDPDTLSQDQSETPPAVQSDTSVSRKSSAEPQKSFAVEHTSASKIPVDSCVEIAQEVDQTVPTTSAKIGSKRKIPRSKSQTCSPPKKRRTVQVNTIIKLRLK